MKYETKTRLLLAAVVLLGAVLLSAVSLTACQGDSPSPAETSAPTETQTPAEMTAPTETQTPAETTVPTETQAPAETPAAEEDPSPAVAFYRQLATDMAESDPGLCGDIELFYFSLTPGQDGSFSTLPALEEGDMTSLLALLGEDFSVQAHEGSYEEVKALGLLEDDGLSFPNGVILTLTDKGDGTFDAELWRSGLGAIFWLDCTLQEEETGWSYQVGGFAIS